MSDALLVSLRVTLLAAPAIALLGIIGAVLLAHWRSPWRNLVELACILPIVLPPTVTGYYLLNLLGRHALGQFVQLLFTPVGAAIAATVMGLPLMVIAGKAAIAGVDARLEAAARTLGASEWRVLCDITLPLARRGLVAGFLLACARAFGEFGATLMVAGSQPGSTRTLSIALYDAVQLGDDATALAIVALLTGCTVAVLALTRWLERGGAR